jgi:HK97 family phage major capsid protein
MRTSDPRYKAAFATYIATGGREQTRALALGSGTGALAVPYDLDPTWILTNDGSVNPLREIARVEKVSGTHIQLVTSAGVTVHRDGEAQAVQDGSPTLADPDFNAGRVSGYLPFSYEYEDAASNLMGQLTNALAEAKADEEASIFVTGSGDGLTGIQGLNQLDALAAGAYMIDVDTTGEITAADIVALDDALAPRHRRNASFLSNKPTQNSVRLLADADGADLWVRIGSGLPNELLGYQIREMSEMVSQGDDTTNPFLILGDFKKYLVVDRIGMRVMFDNLVKDGTGVPTGQAAIVAFWWNGGGFIDPNAFRGLTDNGA